MSKPFRQVVSLWLTPDFTELRKGREEAHWINHDDVDFQDLGEFIANHFQCGERVRIRMANDTIDQVTLHERWPTHRIEIVACDDFAEALFASTRGQRPVIDVRKAWAPLHVIKDRQHSPPPAILMFVVEGGFEAVNLWIHQACLRLSIRAADVLVMLEGSATARDHEGHLTPELSEELRECFGMKYKSFCQLHHTVGRSALPAWAE